MITENVGSEQGYTLKEFETTGGLNFLDVPLITVIPDGDVNYLHIMNKFFELIQWY